MTHYFCIVQFLNIMHLFNLLTTRGACKHIPSSGEPYISVVMMWSTVAHWQLHWLTSWLAGLIADLQADWHAGWLTGLLAHRLADWTICWLTGISLAGWFAH